MRAGGCSTRSEATSRSTSRTCWATPGSSPIGSSSALNDEVREYQIRKLRFAGLPFQHRAQVRQRLHPHCLAARAENRPGARIVNWTPLDLTGAARQLLDAGATIVCVTEGADGVTGHIVGGGVKVLADQVEVVDTVGAGDTFNAGVLASLHDAGVLTKDRIPQIDETTLRDALTFGVRAAAVTVSRAGANPPTREELG